MHINTYQHESFVFVYGSNLAGKNGKGSALTAKRYYQACDGVGEGFTSDNAYAIPTKDRHIKTLPLSTIHRNIDTFFIAARSCPSRNFMLTRVGCGLAGYTDSDIVKHLATTDIPNNVFLPGIWLSQLGKLNGIRVIVAGGRDFTDLDFMQNKLTHLFSNTDVPITIVSGAAKGADTAGENCAAYLQNVTSIVRFPAAWNTFGNVSGILRNSAMSWFSTHAVVFWDGASRGSKHMLDTAKRDNLHVRYIHYNQH